MEEKSAKNGMKLPEFLSLWAATLLSLMFFTYMNAPNGSETIKQFLLQNAQDILLYVGGYFFVLPLVIIFVSYLIAKAVISVLQKGATKRLYVFLLTLALIVQSSFYVMLYLIDTVL